MRDSKTMVTLLALVSAVLSESIAGALDVEWANLSPNPDYLLAEENLANPGGVDYSWYGEALTNPGQRNLSAFRQEMSVPGRYGGGVNWDDLPNETVIADSTGVALDVVGLPFDVSIIATTSAANPLRVLARPPGNEGPISGANLIQGFGFDPRELSFQFQTPAGFQLRGFGVVLVDSGWNLGGATLTFYNEDIVLAQFGPDDGVLFHDHPTDDNFIGYWAATAITRVHIEADGNVLLGRFDDVALVFVPEERGACCYAVDTCADYVEPNECVEDGGRFLGGALTCAGDPDNDGVVGCDDVCPTTIATAGVDAVGRPLGDLNNDCLVDLLDYAIFQGNFSGP